MPRDSQSVQISKSEERAPGQDGVGGQRSWPEEHEVGETVMNSTVGSRRRAEATEPAPSMSVLAVLNSKVGSHRRSAATSQLPVCRRWLGIRRQPPQGRQPPQSRQPPQAAATEPAPSMSALARWQVPKGRPHQKVASSTSMSALALCTEIGGRRSSHRSVGRYRKVGPTAGRQVPNGRPHRRSAGTERSAQTARASHPRPSRDPALALCTGRSSHCRRQARR